VDSLHFRFWSQKKIKRALSGPNEVIGILDGTKHDLKKIGILYFIIKVIDILYFLFYRNSTHPKVNGRPKTR